MEVGRRSSRWGVPAVAFAALKADVERLASPERSFVPVHKKGGTIAYETLIASAPTIAFWGSPRSARRRAR